MKAAQILAVALSSSCATAGASDTAHYIREQSYNLRAHVQSSISLGAGLDELKGDLQTVAEDAAEPGWDGYGAAAVTAETMAAAWTFLECLPSAMELPTVTAEPDGQISFEWYRSPNRLLSVSVSEEGEVHFAATMGREHDSGTRIMCGALPVRIAQLIAEVCTV